MPDPRKPAGDGPKKKVTPAARRRQLLDAAAALVRKRGYAGLTPEDVAAAAGVKAETLARHFPSKAALLAGLYAEFHAAAFVPPADDLDPVAHLSDLPARFAAAAKAHPGVVPAVVGVLSCEADAADREAVRAGLQRSEDSLAAQVRAGQAAGVVRRTLDPAAAARDWLRFLFGGELLRSVDPATDDRPAELLFHGLMKTDV
jgi:AcrR family transcriptional regulator